MSVEISVRSRLAHVSSGSAERRIRRPLAAACAALAVLLLGASAAQAQQAVTVSWDRNTDAYTVGYRLDYGTASGNYQWSLDVGNQTTAPLNLTPGSVYYVQVRAYNSAYQYGPGSSEASVNLVTTAAPTAQIQAVLRSANTALVTWQTTSAVSATINGAAVASSGSTTVTVTANTTFTVVATSASGATARASATVTLATTAAPTAPTNLTASVSGSRVSLAWGRGTGGSPATEYLLYVSTTSRGNDVLNAFSVGNVLTAAGDLPRGRYYARVRARNGSGTSTSSNQVEFVVGRRLVAPAGFRVTWQGTRATLSWTPAAAVAAEDVPSSYVLEAGSGPGLADVASIAVGNVTSFSTDIGAGTYYVRVRSVNEYGGSQATTDVVLIAPGAPAAPTALSSSGSGSVVGLRWTAPPGGGALTGYIIEAGSEPGLSDLAKLRVSALAEFSTEAPPGTYYVRVRAVNDRGTGPASNEILVQR